MELISIIVTVYNVENYLARCLDSILMQTHTELEIILIDDGSQDGSGHLCREYVQYNSRIKYFRQENRGVAAARNKGIALATGMYLGFVDADDWIVPGMYARLYAEITRHGADLAICRAYPGSGCVARNQRNKTESDVKLYTREEGFKALVCKDISSSTWDKLYKHPLLQPDTFPEGMYYEDLYAMPAILMKCNRIVSVEEPYYHYNAGREGSICHLYTVKAMQDFFNASQFRNRIIAEYFPVLKLETERSQAILNYYVYRNLVLQTAPSPERSDLMLQISKQIRKISLNVLRTVPGKIILGLLIIQYFPGKFPQLFKVYYALPPRQKYRHHSQQRQPGR